MMLSSAPPCRAGQADTVSGPSAEAILTDLKATVRTLSVDIGERHQAVPDALLRAAAFIETSLKGLGLVVRSRDLIDEPPQPPEITTTIDWMGGQAARNMACPIKSRVMGTVPPVRIDDQTGKPKAAPVPALPAPPLLLVAHYDTVPGTPGANDNASGVAVLLALARVLAAEPPRVPVMLAFVPNEEEPRFMTAQSGSVALAAQLDDLGLLPERAIAVDSVGWSGENADRRSVLRLSPRKLTVGARPDSGALARSLAEAMADHADVAAVVTGDGGFWIDKSDHASFAPHGCRTALLTGSGTLASPCLHGACDTADDLDYSLMQDAVAGLAAFVQNQSAPR